MADDFINWDDLDLDDVLGENNWTDADEQNDILGSEQEWFSSDNDSFPPVAVPVAVVQPSTANVKADNYINDKENKKIPKPPSRKNYRCPLCEKEYSSTSGFRGHVVKKHNRPDIKAHRHQIRLDGQEIEDVHLPPSKVPLSSKADFEEELPRITKSALEDLKHDKNHTSPDSIAGQFILQIAAVLLLQLPTLCSFLFVHLNSAFLDVDSSQLFKNAHQLCLNIDFINGFSDIIVQNMTMEIPAKFLKRFVQHFLTKFIASFLKRKAELIDTHKELEVETLSDNDNQVIFYICGYIIHALKKRYYKIKRHSKRDRLLSSLDNLLSTDNEDLPVSDWMKAMNRGGLKKPSDKFYKLMVQVEKWLRESVHTENLHQDSLISLKVKLMDYQLLNTCWDRIVTIGDDKLLLLDHVLALFLKVRGFALVKLVRKDICKKRKQSKTAAGTKKSLRRELKEMNKAN